MRCSRCGNDNPADNRYCGMCGATLLAPTPLPSNAVPETQTQRAASAGAGLPSITTAPPVEAVPVKEPPRPAPPAPHDPPSITGPSFLGLNDPAPRKRASLSIDPHHGGHSGNLDYLLEDEEEHKSGGAGKGIFILVVLLIVVGFGYLRWRNNGFRWSSSENKPAPTEQSPAEPSANTPATSPSITPEHTPAPSQPAAQTPQTPAPATKSAATNPPAQPANAAKSEDSKPADEDKSAEDSSADTTPDDTTPAAAAPAKTAKVPTPKPARPVPAKPSPAAKPTRAGDPVAEAQKYLYGKGAPQSCDRGLQLLKPEANKANPKAMIEMGALYSAGLCTPRDLPTAYRWFAQALRKDPDNMAVQTDLQKLWGEMTQPERQLAIKLSQ